jgi:hypothetical protein
LQSGGTATRVEELLESISTATEEIRCFSGESPLMTTPSEKLIKTSEYLATFIGFECQQCE